MSQSRAAISVLLMVLLALGAQRKAFGEWVPPLWRELIKTQRRAMARHDSWTRQLASMPQERRLGAVIERFSAVRIRAISGPEPGRTCRSTPRT